MPKTAEAKKASTICCAENLTTSKDLNSISADSIEDEQMKTQENRNWQFRDAYEKHHATTKETMQEFGERSGIGSYWAISQLVSGRRPLTLEIAYKAAKAMGVPINEVIDKETTKLILDCYAAFDSKLIVKANMRQVVSLYSPVQALKVAMGENAESLGEIQTDYAPDRDLIAIKVQNEEMFPRLKPNDIVIVDLKGNPQPKDIVLVKVPRLEKTLLREYIVREFDKNGNGIYELRTTDQDFPKYTSGMEGVEILGIVIERRTMRLEDH